MGASATHAQHERARGPRAFDGGLRPHSGAPGARATRSMVQLHDDARWIEQHDQVLGQVARGFTPRVASVRQVVPVSAFLAIIALVFSPANGPAGCPFGCGSGGRSAPFALPNVRILEQCQRPLDGAVGSRISRSAADLEE
jgi:hypothetical protein